MVNTQAGVGLDSFDQETDGQYRAAFDVPTVPPSLALASAIAGAMDADPTDIDPLYESLDPDALNALVGEPRPTGDPIEITLYVENFEVTISNTGSISLEPQTADGGDGGIAVQGRP